MLLFIFLLVYCIWFIAMIRYMYGFQKITFLSIAVRTRVNNAPACRMVFPSSAFFRAGVELVETDGQVSDPPPF